MRLERSSEMFSKEFCRHRCFYQEQFSGVELSAIQLLVKTPNNGAEKFSFVQNRSPPTEAKSLNK
jgi:hypothetical protein